jgi:5-methylcytosine-specific restriction endonuclease McrA
VKLCTVCGVVTSGPGSRCTAHAQQSNRSRHNPLYATREWQRLSVRIIAAHVGAFGWVCPGDGPDHRAHPSRSLTVDHILTLSAGGAPLDRANLRVLCRSRNSELGARTGNALRRVAVVVLAEPQARGLLGTYSKTV